MKCRICDSIVNHAFSSKVLNKYDVNYFKCQNCGLLFTEKPYWLDEAYSRPINISDTGLLSRNIYFSEIVAVLIYFNLSNDAKYLDYAGGYGIFTRLMRDIGFDFYWNDPYTQNLFAKGLEYESELNLNFECITAFEVFEHLEDPKSELEKMSKITDNIFLSTEIVPVEIPDSKNWWYYGFEHGQHISFYSLKTFIYLAKIFNLNYYNINGLHLLSKNKYNKQKLIFLKKVRNYGLFQFVKRKMESKTLIDNQFLKKDNIR